MSLAVGVSPSGKGSLAVAALFWQERLPATLIACGLARSLDEALGRIVGLAGEWGGLGAVAVAAPLTWSGAPGGLRAADAVIRERLPSWAPRAWARAPLSQPSAAVLQGPALAWRLADEIRHGQLPRHAVVECHPRLALARLFPDQRQAVLALAAAKTGRAEVEARAGALAEVLVRAGIVQLETPAPRSAAELEAAVAALTALAAASPDAGLVTHELAGGDIRPVGRRPIVLLEGLP